MTPQIGSLGKTRTVVRVSTHICGVSQKIYGKMFIFRVNIGMWTLKSIVSEKQALFWGFQHTFMVFWGDKWENVHFESKPRHVTPQINRLGKMSTSSELWIHIYGVSREIDEKTCTLNLQLLHNTKKTNKVVWTCKDDWPPKRNFYIQKTFYPRG